MTIREQLEQREHKILSPYASFSDESKGRAVFEEQCDLRPVYQRDRDRILHSKTFRRLKGKTQVFLAPEGTLPYPDDPYPGSFPECQNGRQGTDAE